MSARRQMRIGLSIRYLGYHAAAWRHPDVPPGGASDYQYFLNSARIAERGKLDMIFFADGIGIRGRDEPAGSLCRSAQNAELEPLTLLAALAPMTKHIGLVATASTTYNEPFHIARKYASIDHISGGRAAWNIVTSWSDNEARNFSREKHLDYDTRYERGRRSSSKSSPDCGIAGRRMRSRMTRRRAYFSTRTNCMRWRIAGNISRCTAR